MLSQTPEETTPPTIRNILLIDANRPEVQIKPLSAAGARVHAIVGSKWRIIPKALPHLQELKSADIDVIVTTGYGTHATLALILRTMLGVPAVLRMRGNPWREYAEKLDGNNNPLMRPWVTGLHAYTNHNLSRLDGVLPVARHLETNLRAEFAAFSRPVLPVPIPVKHMPPPPDNLAEVRNRWAPNGQKIVASITNFRYWQKAGPMLDAAPHLAETLRRHQCVWVIAGNGEFADTFFEKLAQRCPENLWVRAGFVEDAWSLLYAAAAFLHLSELDGMPNVVLEAQACGCPVIANDFPAMAELIEHGITGLLVEHPSRAAEELDRLLTDDDLCRNITSQGARYIAENHTDEAVGREYLRALSVVKSTWRSSG